MPNVDAGLGVEVMSHLPPASTPSPLRHRGVVVDLSVERGFGFVQQRNWQGVGYGPRAFFHRGAMRGADRGPTTLPPIGTPVSYVMVTMPDGRRRAEDVAVESTERRRA